MAKRNRPEAVRNVVVVSDLHSGCRLGLCPPKVYLDDGGTYNPSGNQQKTWAMWLAFWEWVKQAANGEPYVLVVNGDAIDGVHHRSTTQVSQNIGDQVAIARSILEPQVRKASAYFHVRGTEAHVGPSAEHEERLARDLGAVPNDEGQFARWDLWLDMGGDDLIHFLHHVGTTGSSAYEATAVHKELVESFVEAGRWGDKPPKVIVRSHRHRQITISMPGLDDGFAATVTPGWQLKTPFTFKIPGARQSQPQMGGILIRKESEGLTVRAKTWHIERPQPVRL